MRPRRRSPPSLRPASRRRSSLAQPHREAGRAVPARRRHRRGRAHPHQPAVGGLGPAGHRREQARRRQQYRRRAGRARRSRRLHHPDRRAADGGQPLPVQVAGLRFDHRLRAGDHDLPLPQSPGGAELLAGEDGPGAHRPRQGRIRQVHLRVVRHRHLAAPVRRVVQAHGRLRDDARPLSRRGAGAQRRHPGTRRHDVQHRRRRAAAGRAPARCAGSRSRTAKRFPTAPEFPTVAESGLPGFDVTSWYALLRAGQDARRDRQEDPRRHRRRSWPSPRSRRGSSRSASRWWPRRRQELGARLKAETEQWGPIIKAAGIKTQMGKKQDSIMLDRRRFTRLAAASALAARVRPQRTSRRHRIGRTAIVRLVVPVHARRRHRRDRPHRRRAAVGDLGPAGGGREQARRRRQYRHRIRRPLDARRLHHADHRRRAGDQPVPVPVDQLRSDRRLRAGHADLPVPQSAGGAEGFKIPLGRATSSRTPRRTPASSPTPRPATAPRRT